MRHLPLVLAVLGACGDERAAPPAIRFLHTLGVGETELFNATMAERGFVIEPSLVPFARGQQVIGEILRSGKHCPDLIRIDATWLPGLAGLLAPVPPDLATLDWLPEAAQLASETAVPEAVDGLVVIRDEAAPAPASPSIEDLLAAARAARHAERPTPLGVRVDGYWFLPWLRSEGADLGAAAIDNAGATRALERFAALFGDVAPPPPPAGGEAPDELRRWTNHEIAYWITGPWQIGALAQRDRLQVSALAKAPRGGQVLVVPTCAEHPANGWRLARELTLVEIERRFAQAFARVPSRKRALDSTPPLVQAVYTALRTAEMLPRSAQTPLLFDDLNPALAAVVYGDATPDEAIAGVRRGWRRLEHQR